MRILTNFIFFLFPLFLFAQDFVISGTVSDQAGFEIPNVNIEVKDTPYGTVSNFEGKFEISLEKGNYTLVFQSLSFQTEEVQIELNQNQVIQIQLQDSQEELDDVIVQTKIEKTDVRSTQMSANSLTSETIKKVPVVLGEPDVIRSLIQLPGVSSAGEGASGFNVRGGGADQNLILVDDATIFNSSHLFGLFSIFNPDAIKDLTLFKGGIPAKYGGRVSSVLDIQQRSGNPKSFSGEGSIGVVSSKLLLEGPMKNEKTTYLVSGRSSYAHLFLQLADNPNSAYFYDVNAKVNHRFDKNNNLSVSAYYGRDVISINDNFVNTFGTTFVSTRWSHTFNEQLYSNMSLIFNDYFYNLNLDSVGFEFDSGVRNINYKYAFNYLLNDQTKVDFGFETFLHEFNPGNIRPNDESSGILARQLTKNYANENALFVDVNQELTKHISIKYGLRLSAFLRQGQNRINVYENDLPVVYNPDFGIYEQADPVDVISASRSEILNTFINFEPRLAVSYAFNDNHSIKAGYNRMVQNLHLITNSSSPTPLDVWAPSGQFIDPQLLDQVAVGYFSNLSEDKFSIETEVFYRKIQNSIDFIDGANLIANDNIERDILIGEGRAYGWEFMFKKNTGKLTGWIAYTLSRSEQRTPGRTPEEPGINNGEWYLNNFDKTHDLSVVASYELDDRWELNLNFIAQTGQPVNFPVGQYQFQDLTIPVFEGRNLNRLPTFHRLDLGVNHYPRKYKDRNWKAYWNFSIYNAYNRMNANSIIFRQDQQTGQNEAVRLAIFGIVPALSYNVKF